MKCPFKNDSTGTWFDCIEEECQAWNYNMNTCGLFYNKCDTDERVDTPFAPVLLAEFLSSQDLDKNGLVYGKDFMIDNDDPNKPLMLKAIENTPEWRDPESKVMWEEILIYVEEKKF